LTQILKSKFILAGLLISFAVIAAVDLVIPAKPFFPDENRFIEEAKTLSETGAFVTFGQYRAWETPLAAIVYAPFYRLFGGGLSFIRMARVFQAFLHVLTAIGAAVVAYSIFKDRLTATIAMSAMIIYPSLLAYQSVLLSETLFIFLLVWGFALLYLWNESPGSGLRLFISSVEVFSLSFYAKAVLTVLTPALVASRSIAASERKAARLKYTAASCLILLICFSPWWVRNWQIFGRFVPFTTSASWNLYLGNNPANKNAGVDWSADVDAGEYASIMSLGGELAINEAFAEKAKAYILGDKAAFFRNAWLKFKRFWNFQSNYAGGNYSMAFRLYNLSLALSWGLAFPLGMASAWLNRGKWLELLPIYVLVAYFTIMHVVVIASLRYRLPIEPFFIIVGADSVRRIIRGYCESERKLFRGR
jgi:4-amino-4-deoxy-L-arabinose transferase-like glycosyltransferase